MFNDDLFLTYVINSFWYLIILVFFFFFYGIIYKFLHEIYNIVLLCILTVFYKVVIRKTKLCVCPGLQTPYIEVS